MVLTQRKLHKSIRSWTPRFHTTMVLTQPMKVWEDAIAEQLFPYHYGSYATDYIDELEAKL